MNVTISADTAEIRESMDTSIAAAATKVKAELDSIFRGSIKTPEAVIETYDKLYRYKLLSGEDYKITFEENTIV